MISYTGSYLLSIAKLAAYLRGQLAFYGACF